MTYTFPYVPGSINSLVLGDGKPPTFNDGNPYNGYINPYYWVDDHPLLYGNNGSLDPGTYHGPPIWPNYNTLRIPSHLPRVGLMV